MVTLPDNLERSVSLQAAYDHRADGGGQGPVNLFFVLRGPKGVITLTIFTGWFLPSSREALVVQAQAGGDPQWVRSINRMFHGEGGSVGIHTPTPRPEEGDTRHDDCDWIPGSPCYGTTSFLIAGEWFEALIAGGDDALWPLMEAYYAEQLELELSEPGGGDAHS